MNHSFFLSWYSHCIYCFSLFREAKQRIYSLRCAEIGKLPLWGQTRFVMTRVQLAWLCLQNRLSPPRIAVDHFSGFSQIVYFSDLTVIRWFKIQFTINTKYHRFPFLCTQSLCFPCTKNYTQKILILITVSLQNAEPIYKTILRLT